MAIGGRCNGSPDVTGLTEIPFGTIPVSSGKQAMLLMLELGVDELTGIWKDRENDVMSSQPIQVARSYFKSKFMLRDKRV